MALDYAHMIHLDAENLAETGIAMAYDKLLPKLREYVADPTPIKEVFDPDAPSYAVVFADRVFPIYGPELGEEWESWGRATFALFAIVNLQMADSPCRFYAFYCGNDLEGMFLTPDQAEAEKSAIPDRYQWPYLPEAEPPWFGQHH